MRVVGNQRTREAWKKAGGGGRNLVPGRFRSDNQVGKKFRLGNSDVEVGEEYLPCPVLKKKESQQKIKWPTNSPPGGTEQKQQAVIWWEGGGVFVGTGRRRGGGVFVCAVQRGRGPA